MFELHEAPETATSLVITAMGLLDTFDWMQRAAAVIPSMDDPRRVDWDIIPRPDRLGIALHGLDRHQKVLVFDLIRRALPRRTFTKVLAIAQLEHVLRDYEGDFLGPALQTWRTSDSYHLTFFGRPAFEDTWMMRFLGHHVCLNVTVIDQRWICATPSALGAQPTEYDGVLKPLADDEGLAFALLDTFDDEQRTRAVIHDVAPADFVTRQVADVGDYEYPDVYDLGMPGYSITDHDRRALKFERHAPAGIHAEDLSPSQQSVLWSLIECYLERFPEELLVKRRNAMRLRGMTGVHFAWAGGLVRRTPHYFRIHTPEILIEAVNSVGEANHLHTVLREFDHDFGHQIVSADRTGGQTWGRDHLRTRWTSSTVLDPDLG